MSFEKKYIFVHEICNIAEWYYHTWQTVLIKPMTQNQQNKAKTNAINWKQIKVEKQSKLLEARDQRLEHKIITIISIRQPIFHLRALQTELVHEIFN